MMFRSMATSNHPPTPGSGRSDPARIEPYLTHLVTHHGQLTLVPPQNAGRIRKSPKKGQGRPRADRRRDGDEPRFNIAAPTRRATHASERSARATVGSPRYGRDSIPDYPPPSFQEALREPPFVPPPVSETSTAEPDPQEEDDQEESPANTSFTSAVQERSDSPPLGEAAQPPPLRVRTAVAPFESTTTLTLNTFRENGTAGDSSSGSGSDGASSIDVVSLRDTAEGQWDKDREMGVPLQTRVAMEQRRLLMAESTTQLVSPASSSTQHCSHHPPRKGDHSTHPRLCLDSPGTGSTQATPPGSPKGKGLWLKKLFTPSTVHDRAAPQSPLSPKSPTFSLLPSALASAVTLVSNNGSPVKSSSNSPSARRRDSSGVRKLFTSSKGKEREHTSPSSRGSSDESLEGDWDIVNRASVFEPVETSPPKALACPVKQRSNNPSPTEASASSSESRPHAPNPSPLTTAFLNRSVRHLPSSSSATFPTSPSTVSLLQTPCLATPTSSSTSEPTPKQKKVPPPVPPRRKAMSNTFKPSPSVVWLAPIDTERANSVSHGHTGSSVSSAVSAFASPTAPRPSPSMPTLRSSPRQEGETFYTTPNTPASTRSPSPSAASMSNLTYYTTSSPFSDQPPSFDASVRPTQRPMNYPPYTPPTPPGAMTPTYSTASTAVPDSPPETPTTPTHHYLGRPLPQPPRQPSPLGRAMLPSHIPLTAEVSMSSEYSARTDLDDFAARVIDSGDRSGRHYEDLLLISEFAGPAGMAVADPALIDVDPVLQLKCPPEGRVECMRRRVMRDGRVKLKLVLMGVTVDKCGICLSQFRDGEVACLGTQCQHAFHQYCLKRWLVRSRTCPLCRSDI